MRKNRHFRTIRVALLISTGFFFILVGCDEKDRREREVVNDRNLEVRRTHSETYRQNEENSGSFELQVAEFTDIDDSRLLELEVLRKLGKQLRSDPQAVLVMVDNLEDGALREKVRVAVLVVTIKENREAAATIIPSLPKGEIPAGILDMLVSETARNQPEALVNLANILKERYRDALRAGLADYYRQDLGATGRFPNNPLLGSYSFGVAALKDYLQEGGAPKNVEDLDTWIGGAGRVGDAQLAVEACRMFAEANPESADEYLKNKSEKIPKEFVEGILAGVGRVDRHRAGRLLLE
ncbi:MAG: hypothetical protein EOP04_19395, partial [Proteobacteria bacterium]